MSDAGPNHSPNASPPETKTKEPPKKRKLVKFSDAWREASALVAAHRGRLSLGLALMLVNRLSGAVLPFLSKRVIDDVILKEQVALLWPIAWIGIAVAVIQAGTGFVLSQVLGVAAQDAINEMRK